LRVVVLAAEISWRVLYDTQVIFIAIYLRKLRRLGHPLSSLPSGKAVIGFG
jgi:hypothetical protein